VMGRMSSGGFRGPSYMRRFKYSRASAHHVHADGSVVIERGTENC
jgi:hypothetical protein